MHREIAESPCVDELAGALTQFFLGRYQGREPELADVKPRVASLTNGVGFLNLVDEFIDAGAHQETSG